MKRVLSISEMLDPIEVRGERVEIVVCGEALLDEETSMLTVGLSTATRPEQAFDSVPWLPEDEHVRVKVDPLEASDCAKDVFHSWVRKVEHLRQSAPSQGSHGDDLRSTLQEKGTL